MQERHHVVVVGGGFGGLQLVNDLKGAPVKVTLIDRRNHHLFQPLLYQVATTVLATSEIAWPIRRLYRDRQEVTTLLGEVAGVDMIAKEVTLAHGQSIPYDTLVLATGATHAYFGHDEWAAVAPGLKTLEDATTIRRRVLIAFEQAEVEEDTARRDALLTFTIIGAGPTGSSLRASSPKWPIERCPASSAGSIRVWPAWCSSKPARASFPPSARSFPPMLPANWRSLASRS